MKIENVPSPEGDTSSNPTRECGGTNAPPPQLTSPKGDTSSNLSTASLRPTRECGATHAHSVSTDSPPRPPSLTREGGARGVCVMETDKKGATSSTPTRECGATHALHWMSKARRATLPLTPYVSVGPRTPTASRLTHPPGPPLSRERGEQEECALWKPSRRAPLPLPPHVSVGPRTHLRLSRQARRAPLLLTPYFSGGLARPQQNSLARRAPQPGERHSPGSDTARGATQPGKRHSPGSDTARGAPEPGEIPSPKGATSSNTLLQWGGLHGHNKTP